jgi:hypothetical protein
MALELRQPADPVSLRELVDFRAGLPVDFGIARRPIRPLIIAETHMSPNPA